MTIEDSRLCTLRAGCGSGPHDLCPTMEAQKLEAQELQNPYIRAVVKIMVPFWVP